MSCYSDLTEENIKSVVLAFNYLLAFHEKHGKIKLSQDVGTLKTSFNCIIEIAKAEI